MTTSDEALMLASIGHYRALEEPRVAEMYEEPDKAEMYTFDFLNSAGWEDKYDRLYREFGPREQFGKTFSRQYCGRRSAA